MVAAAAAIRGAAVAVSGAVLAAAISLVLWALTPASGSDATVAVRAGVAGFAAANLIPVSIGGVALTIPPLLSTLMIAALLVVTARRGRFLPMDRKQETVAVLVTAACYGLAVAVITRAFAPEGVVPAPWVWTATALGFVAVAGATVCGRSAWHDWWRTAVPGWVHAGCRAAGIGVCVMLAGGGVALTAAMVLHFGSMVSVGALAAPSWTDGLGMALLGVAYVPNAVVAAAGYVSGVGFEIGAGTYSPFGSSTVDLPAMPLLAAAPDSTGRSLMGLALLAVPLLAGCLMARRVARHLGSRSERVLASAVGAALTGVVLGCLSWVARGGVGTALWSVMGAKPLLVAAVVAAELAAVAVAASLLVGARAVPWRVDGNDADTGDDGGAVRDVAAAGASNGGSEVEAASDDDSSDGDATVGDASAGGAGREGVDAQSGDTQTSSGDSDAPTDAATADLEFADGRSGGEACAAGGQSAAGAGEAEADTPGAEGGAGADAAGTGSTDDDGLTGAAADEAELDDSAPVAGALEDTAVIQTQPPGSAVALDDGCSDPAAIDTASAEGESAPGENGPEDIAAIEPASEDGAAPTGPFPQTGTARAEPGEAPAVESGVAESNAEPASTAGGPADTARATEAAAEDPVRRGGQDGETGNEAGPDRAARSAAAAPGVVLPEQRGHMAAHFTPER